MRYRRRRPIKIVCPECSSEDVSYTAYAFWSKKDQNFKVDEIDWDSRYPYCQNCSSELYDPEPEEVFLEPQEIIDLGLMRFDDDT